MRLPISRPKILSLLPLLIQIIRFTLLAQLTLLTLPSQLILLTQLAQLTYPTNPTHLTYPTNPTHFVHPTHLTQPTQRIYFTHATHPTDLTYPTQYTHPTHPTHLTHLTYLTHFTHYARPNHLTHPTHLTRLTHPIDSLCGTQNKKKPYFSKNLEHSWGDSKETWKILSSALGCRSKTTNIDSLVFDKGDEVTYLNEVSNILNNHFATNADRVLIESEKDNHKLDSRDVQQASILAHSTISPNSLLWYSFSV